MSMRDKRHGGLPPPGRKAGVSKPHGARLAISPDNLRAYDQFTPAATVGGDTDAGYDHDR